MIEHQKRKRCSLMMTSFHNNRPQSHMRCWHAFSFYLFSFSSLCTIIHHQKSSMDHHHTLALLDYNLLLDRRRDACTSLDCPFLLVPFACAAGIPGCRASPGECFISHPRMDFPCIPVSRTSLWTATAPLCLRVAQKICLPIVAK